MTRKEMNLKVFQQRPIPHVFFQPRFEPWYDWHKQFDSLPAEIADLSLREVYDMISASMRTVHYYTGQPDPIEVRFDPKVRITEETSDHLMRRRYETPHGDLYEAESFTIDRTWRTVEFAAKSAGDLKALRWLLQHRRLGFSADKYRLGAEYIGDRGVPQFWVPKSPYLALAQQWMKFEDFVFALSDHRGLVEEIMNVIDESYNELYEQLSAARDLPILNFGENLAIAYVSPKYFEHYLIPWYEKRSTQLRKANLFTHIHIDGDFKPLLPYLTDLPFDGLEALTPKPQGDVTLEEIRDNIGDKILLDGIPAVLFLDHHPFEELQRCVEEITRLFHPRLVLGISDELPEAGGDGCFERLKWVAKWAQEYPAK